MVKRKRKQGFFLTRNWKGAVIVLFLIMIVGVFYKHMNHTVRLSDRELDSSQPELQVELLTVSPYTRSGTELKSVNAIVIHYTANPGSTAKDNRDYFESLKDTHATTASCHFIVGLEGEIIQCIPTWEVSYASNERNYDSIAIECCHPDESGEFNEATYRSMVNLSAWLCKKFKLTADDVIRHYDVTGKNCPKYFVEDENAWMEFKEYVQAAIDKE